MLTCFNSLVVRWPCRNDAYELDKALQRLLPYGERRFFLTNDIFKVYKCQSIQVSEVFFPNLFFFFLDKNIAGNMY